MRFEVGEGFFCSVGCGIGLGLSDYALYSMYTFGTTLSISIYHIVRPSDNYLDFKKELGYLVFEKIPKVSTFKYFVLQFITTSAVIVVITAVTKLLFP
jgi:glycerol uptake facilitator-like aquaporin